MSTRTEKTQELHSKGYNCAQAVACAYCDLVGVSEDEIFRMTEGYGLGMGCMEGDLRSGIRRGGPCGYEE